MSNSFEAMTAEEKRVAIARDALKWLDAGRIKPKMGTLLALDAFAGDSLIAESDVRNQRLLQDRLAEVPTCQVCAIGSLFYSAVRRFDSLRCSAVGYATSHIFAEPVLDTYIRQFFDVDQLMLIEHAFELGEGTYDIELRNEAMEKDKGLFFSALHFGHSVDTNPELGFTPSARRLECILQNIIANNGEFKPPHIPYEEGMEEEEDANTEDDHDDDCGDGD
jgi:hypothetical protein